MILNIIPLLAIIGISETSYLIAKRHKKQEPVCVIGGSCSIVLGSKYNKTLGIHNDILGLLFYIGILGSFLTYPPLLIPLVIIGAISSIYFTYLQFFKIKSWCFWCMMSAINTWLFAGIVIWTLWTLSNYT